MFTKKLAGLMAIASLFLAGSAFAQTISGTSHDLRGETGTGGQICIVCHTPHNADISVADAPLWNHEVTTQTFQLYTSATLTATDVGQPAGISKLCLSCHDGVTAIDSFGGVTRTNLMTGNRVVGTDLRDDHPISFAYTPALATADGALEDPSTKLSGLGGTIDADMLFSGGALECGSCHDVHDDSLSPFMRLDNSASALCLTCHNK